MLTTSRITTPMHYRPPWANTHIVGIAGSSGSGKTSLAMKIVHALNLPWVVILSMDSFYKPLNPEQSAQAFRNEYDFDAPESIDFDILVERLRELKQGRKAEIPIYSFAKHQRQPQTTTIYSCHVLILEGIFALYDPRVLELLDMKIFVDTDSDICLARRCELKHSILRRKTLTKEVARDIKQRGRDVNGSIKQWMHFVKPNYERFVEPQKKNADIMVPRGIENTIAIQMIIKHIRRALQDKSMAHIRTLRELGQGHNTEAPLSTNIKVLRATNQIMGLSTVLHDTETPREDFCFVFDRICTLLMEKAIDQFEFEVMEVETPQNIVYRGMRLTGSGEISGVSILRAGGAMERGLKRVVPDCSLGRILIQSNARTGEPELHYIKLPAALERVLVLDPQIGSGAVALMALTALQDHGVREELIVLVSYLASVGGLRRIQCVFPKIRIVVAVVEEGFEPRWVDERYFGC